MREVSSVPEVMKGSVMHRLFQRAFPGFFTYNSLHLWQPFHIPGMNYVLAKAQGKLDDLEDLSDMGVNDNNIEEVEKFVAPMKEGPTGLKLGSTGLKLLKALGPQTKPLKELEGKGILGYTNTEIKQIKDIIEHGKPDSDTGALQLEFKPWKRLIKMPENRFKAPTKATTIYVTNYSTIVDEILAKRSIYKNPGFLDHQVIPKGALRDILTGNPTDKLKKDFEERVEGLFTRLRSKVTPDKEKVFMDYFTQQAQDYLSSGKRDYQKLKEKEVQVCQIDIVSEYVHLRTTVEGHTLTGLLTCWRIVTLCPLSPSS